MRVCVPSRRHADAEEVGWAVAGVLLRVVCWMGGHLLRIMCWSGDLRVQVLSHVLQAPLQAGRLVLCMIWNRPASNDAGLGQSVRSRTRKVEELHRRLM